MRKKRQETEREYGKEIEKHKLIAARFRKNFSLFLGRFVIY